MSPSSSSSTALTNTYWDLAWVQYLYDKLGKTNSLENEVDQLWTNICMREFPATEDYNLFVRDRVKQYLSKSPDIMVKQIQNGNPFTIIIMENKRASDAGQSTSWTSAVDELTEYLDFELKGTNPKPNFQVGLVAMGRYVRFYKRTESGSLQDYPDTAGKVYEIRDDKVDIQDILLKIKEETKK